MNLLSDLQKILYDNNDKEHEMRITVDWYEVKVELIYNPELTDMNEETVIPIVFDCMESFAYIPDNEYRKKFNVGDFGLDSHEIKIIHEIMSYLELHGKEITDFCYKYSLLSREKKDGDS